MSSEQRKPRTARLTVSLGTILAVSTITLIVLVSGILVTLDFTRGRADAIAAATRETTSFSQRLADRLAALSAETVAPVDLLTSVDNAFLAAPPERTPDKVAVLSAALSHAPHLDGLYAGYPDGSFIHVLKLSGAGWRKALSAPDDAVLAVRMFTPPVAPNRRSQLAFLDADGREISRAFGPETDYDPRTRPWYAAAREAAHSRVIAVGPYDMATTHELGMTIARAHKGDPSIVVGADVILTTVTDLLASGRVTQDTRAFILNAQGRIVVEAGPERLALAGGANGSHSGWTSDMLAPAMEATGSAQRIEIGGRAYLVTAGQPVGSQLLASHRVVVASPLDELLADANSDLQHGLLVALAVVLAAIVLALLLSRFISHSLQILTLGARRMQSLDFSEPIEVRSRVTEISRLGWAIGRAQDAIFTFALYVPKEFVRKGIEAGYFKGRSARREDVTAMFTDIYDFTTISENHSPEELVEMLSGYFDVFDASVNAHDGTIIQFLGDSVYAMWNAPLTDPDHAFKACLCALDVERRLAEFNAEQLRKGLPAFRTRYGIHSGQAVVGSVGATERLQYTGMGDTINVASRLEGMNKELGTVAIASSAVVERCNDKIDFRPLGTAHAKGRTRPVAIFELIGEKTAVAAETPPDAAPLSEDR